MTTEVLTAIVLSSFALLGTILTVLGGLFAAYIKWRSDEDRRKQEGKETAKREDLLFQEIKLEHLKNYQEVDDFWNKQLRMQKELFEEQKEHVSALGKSLEAALKEVKNLELEREVNQDRIIALEKRRERREKEIQLEREVNEKRISVLEEKLERRKEEIGQERREQEKMFHIINLLMTSNFEALDEMNTKMAEKLNTDKLDFEKVKDQLIRKQTAILEGGSSTDD